VRRPSFPSFSPSLPEFPFPFSPAFSRFPFLFAEKSKKEKGEKEEKKREISDASLSRECFQK
jgi:hypothetical protein